MTAIYPGKATLTATASNGATASCEVYVLRGGVVNLTYHYVMMDVGSTINIAELYDGDATWSVSDVNLKISSDGSIIVGNPGIYTIKAKGKNNEDECTIYVRRPVKMTLPAMLTAVGDNAMQ